MIKQHTPGPWITGEEAIWALDDCEFHAIVDCPLNQTCRDTETAWANARLIAAAPDLLANARQNDYALETAEQVLAERGIELKELTTQRARNRLIIAAATGEA